MPATRPLTERFLSSLSIRPLHAPRPNSPTFLITAYLLAKSPVYIRAFARPRAFHSCATRRGQQLHTVVQRPRVTRSTPSNSAPPNAHTTSSATKRTLITHLPSTPPSHVVYTGDIDSSAPAPDLPLDTPGFPGGPAAPDYIPLPFTTSIANTGDVLIDLDYNPADPTLVRNYAEDTAQSYASATAAAAAAEARSESESASESLIQAYTDLKIPPGRRHPTDPSLLGANTNTTTSTTVAQTTSTSTLSGIVHPTTITASTTVVNTNTGMSDQDYAAFLENQSNEGQDKNVSAQGTSEKDSSVKATNTAIPAPLKDLGGAVYTSETDDEFEAVSLSLASTSSSGSSSGKIPSLQHFCDLTGYHSEQVEEQSPKSFDPRSEYKEVVEKVKEAGSGEATVFRVGKKGARVEYWILSVDGKGRKVIGVRVGGVES